MRWLAVGLLALLALLLLSGCSNTEETVSQEIVTSIPWSVPETTTYRLLDSDDEEVGTGQFKIESAEFGEVRFTQHFEYPDRGFVNDAQVIANGQTLQPVEIAYVLEGPDGTLTCEATYEEGKVTAHRTGEDEDRTDTLDIPGIAYDSWADLFLWRTIDFREGFETEYGDVLSCTLDRTQKQNVLLKVTGRESVTVPAGTFDSWHLEIGSGGKKQDAWYSVDGARLLLKYDNGEQTFELAEGPD
jgi:hypothetical protein